MSHRLKKRKSASIIVTKLLDKLALEEEEEKPKINDVEVLNKNNIKDFMTNPEVRKKIQSNLNHDKKKFFGNNSPINTKCLLTT